MSDSMPTPSDGRMQRFLENLVKLIPAEIIALYAVLSGFVPGGRVPPPSPLHIPASGGPARKTGKRRPSGTITQVRYSFYPWKGPACRGFIEVGFMVWLFLKRNGDLQSSGTGSTPPRLHGAHRKTRHTVSNVPRRKPNRRYACKLYSEQQG